MRQRVKCYACHSSKVLTGVGQCLACHGTGYLDKDESKVDPDLAIGALSGFVVGIGTWVVLKDGVAGSIAGVITWLLGSTKTGSSILAVVWALAIGYALLVMSGYA